jgi:hypothetical protein
MYSVEARVEMGLSRSAEFDRRGELMRELKKEGPSQPRPFRLQFKRTLQSKTLRAKLSPVDWMQRRAVGHALNIATSIELVAVLVNGQYR